MLDVVENLDHTSLNISYMHDESKSIFANG